MIHSDAPIKISQAISLRMEESGSIDGKSLTLTWRQIPTEKR